MIELLLETPTLTHIHRCRRRPSVPHTGRRSCRAESRWLAGSQVDTLHSPLWAASLSQVLSRHRRSPRRARCNMVDRLFGKWPDPYKSFWCPPPGPRAASRCANRCGKASRQHCRKAMNSQRSSVFSGFPDRRTCSASVRTGRSRSTLRGRRTPRSRPGLRVGPRAPGAGNLAVHDLVLENADEPGAHRGAAANRSCAARAANQGLLNRILGLVRVAQMEQGIPVEGAAMPSNQVSGDPAGCLSKCLFKLASIQSSQPPLGAGSRRFDPPGIVHRLVHSIPTQRWKRGCISSGQRAISTHPCMTCSPP